jgi:putative (di)nucleoside polyphosphate hydrolase
MKRNYRDNVAMIILSDNYDIDKKIFVAQKFNQEEWEMPQGGLNDGETFIDALYRELNEEITTTDVEILSVCDEFFYYDFDDPVIMKRMLPYTGQRQKYYLIKLNDNSKIDINTSVPEFKSYKFITVDKLLENCPSDRAEVYPKVLKYFKDKGEL